jgi:hypothetical protein
MSIINDLAFNPEGPTLDDMLQAEAALVQRKMDQYNASRHNERMDVTAGYVSDFVRTRRSRIDRIKPIRLSEVVALDPSAVADDLVPDLGPEGRARFADMVQDLTDHARQYLAEVQAVVEDFPQSVAKELAEFIERSLARHVSHPIRSRITLDFAIHPTESDYVR